MNDVDDEEDDEGDLVFELEEGTEVVDEEQTPVSPQKIMKNCVTNHLIFPYLKLLHQK